MAFSEYRNFKGKIIEDKSAVFASRGIASLALAFFGVDGLPTNYDKYVITFSFLLYVLILSNVYQT